jgi:pantoate--beta-alanine ligase
LDEIRNKDALREQLGEWRHNGDHVALVPTMGNLHEGHLSLINIARKHAERVVVSVFSYLDYASGEIDPEEASRILQRDKRRLVQAKADLCFVPDVTLMYPFGMDGATSVTVPILSDEFCGPARPGHFNNVTTVITRLFGLVQPDVAVFGQIDYQQQLIIRRLVEDLSLGIEVVCGPTDRETDGLARSTENQSLSEEQRKIAPQLYKTLQEIAHSLETGSQDYAELESIGMKRLASHGFTPEYVSVRRAENLQPPDRDTDELVILIAASLGEARLTDNVLVHT